MSTHLLERLQKGFTGGESDVGAHFTGGDGSLELNNPLAVGHRIREGNGGRLSDFTGACKKLAGFFRLDKGGCRH